MVNDAILASHRDRFCTVLYAVLEHSDSGWELTTVASGHPLPIHVAPSGQGSELGRHGTVAGILPDLDLHPERTRLNPGDTLILYTDGITDVRPPHGLRESELIALAEQVAIQAQAPRR